ncbi:MAG: zf-TFIIB domain-containing protein [Planctomycetota bacterium]|jgi:Zn-finger nucleic acid-binding protein
MICPGCGAEMRSHVEPDITTDRCVACEAAFLDGGELNVLATGLSGDIEFCSKDRECPPDRFGRRQCPKCMNETMRKVELLRYTDIVFDFCDECQGFFLDPGEVEEMNASLRDISGRERGEELREYQDGHLVTVDLAKGVSTLGASSIPIGTNTIVMAIYFRSPFGAGMRIHSEGWTVKLAKFFGLYRHVDIETGIAEFDGAFVVEATDPAVARRALSVGAQRALHGFVAGRPQLVLQPGALQVVDDRIVYTEGPYAGELVTDVVAASSKVTGPLLAIADAMEGE